MTNIAFKYLTGIKPTGQMHMGNYASTIKPIIDNSLQDETIVLIADLHALTGANKDISKQREDMRSIFRAFDIPHVVFQSEVKEIPLLFWILSNYTAKGLLNRAHGYKTMVDENLSKSKDADKAVYMGLYNYPTLMAADLTIFNTEYVFVGKDQIQHIEMAKEICNKFNHMHKTSILQVPKLFEVDIEPILGFDGRKMSKSYDNTIPLFCSDKKIKKLLNSVKTNCKLEGEPKQYDETPLTSIFDVFAFEEAKQFLKEKMQEGVSWKFVKQYVISYILEYLQPYKDKYEKMQSEKQVVTSKVYQLKQYIQDEFMPAINNLIF